MLEMRLIIRGKVQKVGYRWSVVEFVKTSQLDVVGIIRNLPDGSVELIAQGSIEALKSIHRFATKGPESSDVREVDQEISEITKISYSEFTMS
jgi:acylphosphatase